MNGVTPAHNSSPNLSPSPPLSFSWSCADHLRVLCTNGDGVDRQNCTTVSYIFGWTIVELTVRSDLYNLSRALMSNHNANKEIDRVARCEPSRLQRCRLMQGNQYAENDGLRVNIRGLE